MSILIACDSFKDALPALDVCEAIGRGFRRAAPDQELRIFPLADGGEGTSEILTYHYKGQIITCTVSDPLFRPVEARYGISRDGETAFIEMAQASGLQLVGMSERNPLNTTSLGTGELIRDAMSQGVRRILLGIGGSATNDAGIGMATALGYRFLDNRGERVEPIGKNLIRISRIEATEKTEDLKKITFEVICDVNNPLFGPEGAAAVYGPQKGADAAAVELLDTGLRHFAETMEAFTGKKLASEAGSGAAGGLGAGAMAFLHARLRPGIETVMDYTVFDQVLTRASLVITGEGKIDGQTQRGKLIQGICQRAGKLGIPVIALCGTLEASPGELRRLGLVAAFSILNRPMNLAEALPQSARLLEEAAFNVAGALFWGGKFLAK